MSKLYNLINGITTVDGEVVDDEQPRQSRGGFLGLFVQKEIRHTTNSSTHETVGRIVAEKYASKLRRDDALYKAKAEYVAGHLSSNHNSKSEHVMKTFVDGYGFTETTGGDHIHDASGDHGSYT